MIYTPSARETYLFQQIKCPTCQGQTINESFTPSSHALRDHIHYLIQMGKSDAEILSAVNQSAILEDTGFCMWALFPLGLFFICFGVLVFKYYKRKA